MNKKTILIFCGILLFIILVWNIIEEKYEFNSHKEIYITTNNFSEGYQKIGELYNINEFAIWNTKKDCYDTIYNDGKGIYYNNMTYEQEFCLILISKELENEKVGR